MHLDSSSPRGHNRQCSIICPALSQIHWGCHAGLFGASYCLNAEREVWIGMYRSLYMDDPQSAMDAILFFDATRRYQHEDVTFALLLKTPFFLFLFIVQCFNIIMLKEKDATCWAVMQQVAWNILSRVVRITLLDFLVWCDHQSV